MKKKTFTLSSSISQRLIKVLTPLVCSLLAFLALSGILGLAGLMLAVPLGLVAAAILLLALKSAAARCHGV